MARTPTASRRCKIIRNIRIIASMVNVFSVVYVMWYRLLLLHLHIMRPPLKTKEEKRLERMNWVFRLTEESDTACISELRMDRRTFRILCEMVRDIGDLKDTKNMSLQEVVAVFVYVLAHHKKNRTMSLLFLRSGETISCHFNSCLLAILKLHSILLKKPVPITEDCQDDCWRCFKGWNHLKKMTWKMNTLKMMNM